MWRATKHKCLFNYISNAVFGQQCGASNRIHDNKSMVKIRKAKREDFEEYLELKKKSLKEYSIITQQKIPINLQEIKKEFEEFFVSPKRFLLIIKENNAYAGFLIGTLITYVFKKTGYIDDIFIKKEFRRRGFANLLIKNFILVTKKKEAQKLRLGVNPRNGNAIKLYKKLGFK